MGSEYKRARRIAKILNRDICKIRILDKITDLDNHERRSFIFGIYYINSKYIIRRRIIWIADYSHKHVVKFSYEVNRRSRNEYDS